MELHARLRSFVPPSWRVALWGLLYYSSIFLIKVGMFACAWRERPAFGGLSFKTCLALAQTFGYASGKIPSLVYSPKLPEEQLRGALMAVIVAAGTAVTLSTFAPPGLSLVLVAMACFALAPAWSILMRFLEGRRDTEAVVAIVSFSYIGCSGLCKGITVDLVVVGFSDAEAVATCAVAGTALGLLAAERVAAQPPPSEADIEKRGRRKQMTNYRAEGGQLAREFGLGLALCVSAYTLLGSLRAYRDYFQLELFMAVGLSGQGASLFATSEFTISVVVLASTACFGLVEDNRRALRLILWVAAGGGVGLAGFTALHGQGWIGGLAWMVCLGASAFLAYVPLGCMLYERLLGAAREQMTSALLNLLADACVLVGTAILLCYKDFYISASESEADASVQSLHARAAQDYAFFAKSCWTCGFVIAALLLLANWSLERNLDARLRARDRGGAPGKLSTGELHRV